MDIKYEITAIEPQKKDPDRSSVYINGEFSFGASNKAVERYGLVAGMVLDNAGYEALMSKLQLDKAKMRALNSIARGDKTEQQMRMLLLKAEYSEWIIEEVISFLKKYSYINDENFVKRYMNSKVKYNHKSLRKVQSELYSKGIVVSDLETYKEKYAEEEEENILYFLNKFKYSSELEYKDKQKIINRILTRGFSYSAVERCIRRQNEGLFD
ncbi:RecX family transcriptional regulator [Niameybacter massiliensis]|uniref:Regulatory protein RecX n=1 Tax=Holtiella tumoricola TaxID=3018743 RepID=A0AA42J1I2_9FIRM|nr:RecX family transcriptional regulator [Niameybacter massiliensis]MDA3732572.1 RecX family transcriptional regulator [Holtiella tumoricola]